MEFQYHANLTLGALRRWLIAQCYECLIVGALWFAALLWLGVPWAPFWALLAGVLQIVPHFGPLLALFGPAMTMLFTGARWEEWLWFLGAYAAIAIADGLLLQPILMRRQNRVPFWASLLTPILLGILIPFWGVLLAPPLLAVVYAYRGAPKQITPIREQQFSNQTEGIILPPEAPSGKSQQSPLQ
jgi:predicted PurR-regulated permease PerM